MREVISINLSAAASKIIKGLLTLLCETSRNSTKISQARLKAFENFSVSPTHSQLHGRSYMYLFHGFDYYYSSAMEKSPLGHEWEKSL